MWIMIMLYARNIAGYDRRTSELSDAPLNRSPRYDDIRINTINPINSISSINSINSTNSIKSTNSINSININIKHVPFVSTHNSSLAYHIFRQGWVNIVYTKVHRTA